MNVLFIAKGTAVWDGLAQPRIQRPNAVVEVTPEAVAANDQCLPPLGSSWDNEFAALTPRGATWIKVMRLAVVAIAIVAVLSGCGQHIPAGYQGYAEGEFVLVAAPAAGKLEKRFVNRGEMVEAGTPLFSLEDENEKAARWEAQGRLKSAEARLANLGASRRIPEVEAVRAQYEQAVASRRLSELQLEQHEKLFAANFISRAALDAAQANHNRDRARVLEIEAQLKNSQLAIGREKEVAAAQADADAARAVVAQSDWRLAQRARPSPAKALVQDTFYSEGEWVPAGSPVVSLLPPANVKVRFFVPEATLGGLLPGRAVKVRCDGCGEPIAAKISFISHQAEYTPPVIYSREQRTKLVFLVEARPAPTDAIRLKPGQPVDVSLP